MFSKKATTMRVPQPLQSPSDFFASLALAPSNAVDIPLLVVSPPSPIATPRASSASNAMTAAAPVQEVAHRSLSLSEARQLTLLLHQSLFPVRTLPKGLMSESICLAEELHEAGIRWDKRRRVMGTHLRGIWEEGQKLGAISLGGEGHRAMERYVQGSFLSIADHPHPLDTMPIPIELSTPFHLDSALPKLTLQSGLAQALGLAANIPQLAVAASGTTTDFPMTPGFMLAKSPGSTRKGTWRDRKKTGLRVKTGVALDLSTRLLSPSQNLNLKRSAAKTTSSSGWKARSIRTVIRELNSRFMMGRIATAMRVKTTPSGDCQARRLLSGNEEEGKGMEITSARRVSVDGWEVR